MPHESLSGVFGLVVKRHRKAQGLSQEVLADLAGIHRTHVGLVERGERNASLDVAGALAQALGRPLSQLIREAERKLTLTN